MEADKIKTVALVVCAGILLIVLGQNAQDVTLRFLFWQFSISRIILMPALVAAGFAAGYFTARK